MNTTRDIEEELNVVHLKDIRIWADSALSSGKTSSLQTSKRKQLMSATRNSRDSNLPIVGANMRQNLNLDGNSSDESADNTNNGNLSPNSETLLLRSANGDLSLITFGSILNSIRISRNLRTRIEIPSSFKIKANYQDNSKISLYYGDITDLEVGAIVNATGYELLQGSGVTRAIIARAGPNFVDECKSIRGCNVGEVRITGGYTLPSDYVLHTVGPSGESPAALRACYFSCLDLANTHTPPIRSVAFPCISTGVKRYPNRKACKVALQSVRYWLHLNKHSNIDRIIFVTFLEKDFKAYKELLPKYFPPALPTFPTYDFI